MKPSMPTAFLPVISAGLLAVGMLGLAMGKANAESLNLLTPSRQVEMRVFSLGMPAPISAFDKDKGTLSLTREGGAVLQSCLVVVPLTYGGSPPLPLSKTGDSVGVRMALGYRPFTGTYVAKGPRLFFASTPWARSLENGPLRTPVKALFNSKGWGMILGQAEELPNFWSRPTGGNSVITSSQFGTSVGNWPRPVLKDRAWTKPVPVEVIFSLTRLENGGLRYYGFCSGVEHQVDLPKVADFETDCLWLDLSNSNAREIFLSALEVVTS